jgi:redox-sensitive bicupin YhaK (pirin superfamily)
MILLRRNTERRHARRGKRETWFTFHPRKPTGPHAGEFGALVAFDEMRLPPGGVALPVPREEAEMITYVYAGAMAQEDSTGNSGVVHAGEFQYMTSGRGVRRKETNASRADWAHFFRISLHLPEVGLDRAHEQKRFSAAQRRNTLCVVAAPDGRKGSLRVNQDALIYSSMLEPGRHLIHELLPGRSAWLHVLSGELALQDIILNQGDGAGVTVGPSASFTASENSEILLIDLPERLPKSPDDGSVP